MKPLSLILALLVALLGGMAIILGAPPYVDDGVRAIIGLGFAAAFGVILGGPIGRALADNLRGGAREEGLLEARLDELLGELQGLRGEFGELHERIDFTERLLAQHRPEALAKGRTPEGGAP